MCFSDLDGDQARTSIDTAQAYTAFRAACDDGRAFAGAMQWKRINGREYLYHKHNQKRYESLGPRNTETEARYAAFTAGKAEAAERVATLDARLKVQGKLARALGIARVPKLVAQVLKAINDEPELRDQVMVVGTNALWAYEAMAGVRFESQIVATRDVDILWDADRQIELLGPLARRGLLGFLQSVDKTFKRDEHNRFRAVNGDGYAVDLLAPDHRHVGPGKLVQTDLVAHRADALNELAESDAIERVVIGHLGKIITAMRVPDPRVFVRHKVWLSKRDDREGQKRRRDLQMAEAVARLIVEHLPRYPLAAQHIAGFSKSVRLELAGE